MATACESCYLNFAERKKGLLRKTEVYCDYYEGYVSPVKTCAWQFKVNHSETHHSKEIEQLQIKKQQFNKSI